MKMLFFSIVMFFCVMMSQAQNDSLKTTSNAGKNEVKLNALFLILGAFEPSYERNLSESSSAGVSLLISLGDQDIDLAYNYYVSPYYRIFFGKKYAGGFFLEGFGMLNSISSEYVNYNTGGSYQYKEKDITDFALGFGLGGKWMTSGGFVFEVNGGIGRNLFNASASDEYDYTPIVGKFGFNLGYRF